MSLLRINPGSRPLPSTAASKKRPSNRTPSHFGYSVTESTASFVLAPQVSLIETLRKIDELSELATSIRLRAVLLSSAQRFAGTRT